MTDDRLELLLVTYNRAGYLERALGQLADSPFADRRLTVLDNNSTDATPDVCRRFEARFPRMEVVRHPRNVGAAANYLRAVELSRSEYTWILADDDSFDFSACDDVFEALDAGRYDLISVGAPGQHDWERGLATTTHELLERGARFFYAYTFVPGFIFRTSLFDSECMVLGYRNVANLYPQMAFLRRAVERDFSVYTSRRQLVLRNEDENSNSSLRWLAAWVRSSASLDDRSLRRRAVYEAFGSPRAWVAGLAQAIAYEKRRHPELVPGELRDLVAYAGGEQRLAVLALAPLALIPRSVYRAIAWTWRKLRGLPDADPVSENDPLRSS